MFYYHNNQFSLFGCSEDNSVATCQFVKYMVGFPNEY